MPQTGKYTAADLAPAQQQGTYSAADIATPDTTQQPPNSFIGGVGRRLASMVPAAPQTISEGLKNVPWLGPIPQALMGVAQNIKQLGPQLVQQAKQGQASHQPGDILPNLYDARTAVTAASMLNPFAAGSVANVNQLQDEGRGKEAAGQGLTDAVLLAAGGAASRVIPRVAGALQDYTPSGNVPKLLGRELTGRLPFLSRFDAFRKPTFSEYADALKPDPQMSLFRNTPKLGDVGQQPAPAQVQEQPPAQQLPFLAKFHDVPNMRVQAGPQAPQNILNMPKSPATPTGPQGEFPVIPPDPEFPPVASPVAPKQTTGDFKTTAQARVSAANPMQRVGDAIKPLDNHVYRIVTGKEYNDAIASGYLRPGAAADTGGTVNFSQKPIPLYGGSASPGNHGLVVEVPESSIPGARTFPGSTDLYLESPQPVPLSSASRAWGMEFTGGNGVKVSELTDLLPQKPSMQGFYGQYSGKSNLKANQRQLASPTAAASPNPSNQVSTAGPHPPEIMKILNTPGDVSDADMAKVQNYFAQQRLTNMLKKAAGQ